MDGDGLVRFLQAYQQRNPMALRQQWQPPQRGGFVGNNLVQGLGPMVQIRTWYEFRRDQQESAIIRLIQGSAGPGEAVPTDTELSC